MIIRKPLAHGRPDMLGRFLRHSLSKPTASNTSVLAGQPRKCLPAKHLYVAIFALAFAAGQAHASTTLTHNTATFIFTPFDNFFNSFSDFMTTTVARVGSLAALVLCGLGYASGKPHAKEIATGTAIGVMIANLAPSFLTWLSS
jgi:TrbC/VIRB2 family pilin